MAARDTDRFAVGRSAFGVAVAASGILQLVTGDFVRLASGDGRGWAGWPIGVGVVLVVAGCAIAAHRRTLPAGAAVAGLLLGVLVFVQVPRLLVDPSAFYLWTNPLKASALLGGAWLVTAPGRGGGGSPAAARSAVVLLAVFLLVAGVQHFVYADFVTDLVPSWLPGRRAWTWFTGAALLAGGAGLLVPRTSRLAAALSALMIFAWVLLLHVPRAVAGPDHAGEAAGVFEALAISGIALMVAAPRR